MDAGIRPVFNRKNKVIVLGDVWCKGLTKVLKKRFWPSWTFKRAKLGELNPRVFDGARPHGLSKHGKRAGGQVDKWIDKLAKLGRSNLPILSYPLPDKIPEIKKWTKQVPQWFRDQVLLWCRAEQLIPIHTQVPVAYIGDSGKAVGTMVDLVCRPAHGPSNARVIVEVKLFQYSYLEMHTPAPLSPPFNTENDCLRHQHYLQCGFSTLLYEHQFEGQHVVLRDRCTVLQFARHGVRAHRIPQAWWDRMKLEDLV